MKQCQVQESYEFHVFKALQALEFFPGQTRLDGAFDGQAAVLRWQGTSPETTSVLIIRTVHWWRYCQAVRRAVAARAISAARKSSASVPGASNRETAQRSS